MYKAKSITSPFPDIFFISSLQMVSSFSLSWQTDTLISSKERREPAEKSVDAGDAERDWKLCKQKPRSIRFVLLLFTKMYFSFSSIYFLFKKMFLNFFLDFFNVTIDYDITINYDGIITEVLNPNVKYIFLLCSLR